MKLLDSWVAKAVQCRTPEEFIEVLFQDVSECCKNVAIGRATINALEKAYPWIEPANDPALKRLRKYGLQAEWSCPPNVLWHETWQNWLKIWKLQDNLVKVSLYNIVLFLSAWSLTNLIWIVVTLS
jgi:hypothetical protein